MKTSGSMLIGMLAVLLAVGSLAYAKTEKKADKASAAKTVTTKSGLKYIDLKVGDGAEAPENGAEVVVHYTGTLENGKKFDSSLDRGQPFSFQIGSGMVIKGWDEGVAHMKVHGKRKLIIKPELGYGNRDMGAIPPNSTLIFEVELLDVKRS